MIFAFTLVSLCAISQNNLVPNNSFEQHSNCPNNGGQTNFLLYWTNPTWQSSASPDYFNTCGTNGYGLPSTFFGLVSPLDSNASVGLVLYTDFSDAREYLQVELLDSLKSGKVYCVHMDVLLADSVQYAITNIGTYFSSFQIDTNMFNNLPYAPQFENSIMNQLSTKNTWMSIDGLFYADGREKFMTIGNFHDNANTNTSFLGGASWCNWSYYFIDNVSVTLCDSLNQIENASMDEFKIFPNPTSDNLTIQSSKKIDSIEILDLLGKNIYAVKCNFNQGTINTSILPNGIYVIKISSEGKYYTQSFVKTD